jgi:WhiB family redox-sensing transcriptional regulator
VVKRRPEVDFDWRDDAPCRDYPTEIWFPEPETIGSSQVARSICAECPIQERCLEHAVTYPEPFGIWAGTTAAQRRRMRQRRRLAG